MSAIVGVFAPARSGGAPSRDVGERVLRAMNKRGADHVAVWRDEASGALVGVSRYAWEREISPSGGVLVLAEDDVVVAADAAIYYRDDLRRSLESEGVVITGDSATHMILASYRAWGEGCAAHLEGDFAFIVWDRRTRRISAARDFGGKRTLFFAEVGGTLVIASSIGGVLAFPGCPHDIDLSEVAAAAGGLFGADVETAYTAIRNLPAGFTLAAAQGSAPRLSRHWSPPERAKGSGIPSFEEAAVELRARLERAVLERAPSRGEMSIWLSGGWDSPAVFAAGAAALRAHGDTRSILPVSISYPPGDPGREDELIQDIADHWDVPVHWLHIADIPFFDRPAERAAERDEPFGHAFEMWHRSLARGSRAVGSRVAFDGVGGDQLFQVSEVYLADLLRSGHWLELRREWKAKRMTGSGFRGFFRQAVQPLMTERAHDVATAMRNGRALRGYLERRAPSWLRPEVVSLAGLDARERHAALPHSRISCVRHETYWYLTYPYFPRVFGLASAMALEEGIELRSPLYDARIIELALSRPRWERSSGVETKLLLRRAVKGLLPEHVLAPRPAKTGTTGAYFDRSMREGYPPLCEEFLRCSELESAGMIDADELRRSATAYTRGEASGQVGVNLFLSLQAELWLRARRRPADLPDGGVPEEPLATVVG
ncbi:MAG TPA: asparagine synthase-related protein [Gemmatimonadaceae bacterium]|nr:asparagine synthase-related protein [Gemmatimonadaceae bacterium]